MATFITSKSVGETINQVFVNTSTGFWKYNHDGVDSSAFNQNGGNPTVTVTNANGEFTIISCDENGNVSGDITSLDLNSNQLTSFDGTGLSSLIELYLSDNQLTSFNGTGLSSLQRLLMGNNQLTSFNSTDLNNVYQIVIDNNQLTSLNVSNLNLLNSLTMYSSKTGGNPMTPSANDTIINKFLQNAIANNFSAGYFESIGGRTSASSSAYNSLIGYPYNFTFQGNLDLVTPPVVGSGRLAIRGFRPTP